MAYSDDYSRSDVPDAVRTYIRDFQNAIESQNISAILQYYETDWNKMTERYFKSTPWPHWRTVENLVGQDAVFILFYKGTTSWSMDPCYPHFQSFISVTCTCSKMVHPIKTVSNPSTIIARCSII